jgi:prepilin peptidase CpaA
MLVGILAGVLDWRFRRIPNWLNASGAVAGIAVNSVSFGLSGAKSALLGLVVGLGILLPFVLIRSIGAGDWKLAGALGACLGTKQLISVLIATVFLAGLLALAVVIYKGRMKQTLLNIAHVVGALFSLRMPPREVSLDNPQATKIPLGVAMAGAVLIYGIGEAIGKF